MVKLRRERETFNLDTLFEGTWRGLANFGTTSWSHPDDGKMERYHAHVEELIQLLLAAPGMLAALERNQWYYDEEYECSRCPDCKEKQKRGHTKGCQLANAITAAKRKG